MLRFLKKPYDLLNYRRFKILLSYGVPFFIFIFLMFFKPFGLSDLNLSERVKVLIINFLGLTIVIFFNSYFLRRLLIKNYTIGNTILWLIWVIFLVSCTIFFINGYYFSDGKFDLSVFLWFTGIVLSTSAIPLTIIVLLHYNFVLVKRLNDAENINEIIKNKDYKEIKNEEIILEDENNHKKIILSLESLLYITAADNYIDIYYLVDDEIKHKLIRNSLTNIERSFENTKQLFRCHKSYIINLNNVINVTGNAAGYKLKLKSSDTIIPVSRKLNSRIIEIFN